MQNIQEMDPSYILIVEDEPHTMELLKEIVSSNGYAIVTARDGYEAHLAFQKHKFRLVFLDLRLPRVSGIEVLKKIRETSPYIPVVVITGSPEDLLAIQNRAIWPDRIIPKPFKLWQIKESLSIIEGKK